jgi:UPF0755 protein
MRRVLAIVLLGLLGIALAAGWAVWALSQPYGSFATAGVYVEVPRGAPRRAIARLLAERGVVRDRRLFEALTRWRSDRTLQAGEYFFDAPATAFEVFDKLAQGRVFVRELTVPEGYTIFEIADLVAREGLTTREDFLSAARDPALVRSFAPRAPSLEGFLFPATYYLPRRLSGEEIVAMMVRRFQREWEVVSAQSPNPEALSLHQAVTLASLVERETHQPEERPLVAGVFLNRLRRRFPLQCDPTVVYALDLAGMHKDRLMLRDLRFDSPYNTYRRPGLPPGPIANPGAMSLRAALDPSPTDHIYFVANAEGGHIFSRTLTEHNRNVARYRQLLAEQRRAARMSSASDPPGATSALSKGSP